MRDDCIELSNLTRESLTLRRQILETREFRRRERENHVALKQQYEQQMNISSNSLRQIIRSNTEFLKQSLNDATITTSSQSSSCIGMTQLKHYDYNDEIIRTMRNQEILDTYTRVVCRQNIQQIEEMKTFISKERMKLNQTKNRLNSVRKELITTQTNVQEQHSFDRLSEDVYNYHYAAVLEQQQQQSRRTMKEEYYKNDYYDTTTDDSTISTDSPTAVQNFPLSSCTTENERNRFHNNTHSNQKRRKTRSKRKKRIHSFSSRKSNLLKAEQ